MLSVAAWIIGTVFIVSTAIRTFEYYNMKTALNQYSRVFAETRNAMAYLQCAEVELKRLLSFKNKEKILENVQPISAPAPEFLESSAAEGSINVDLLKEQMKLSVENIKAVADYLDNQKNIFVATPRGWPLKGSVTSEYGKRLSPIHGVQEFHSGMDIAAPSGTPIKATADGVVTFSGFNAGNGNLVVIEHGLGYTTFYAHNSVNKAEVGQKIKRGDVVALVGSTGNATGPHLHYEVWRNRAHSNPRIYIKEIPNVLTEK
ncbi:MAG: M23 family metallopeptidase [Dissulfurispiraceae bacterium]|nr:M23 family metallopeptidase [Dissulfurispiraceae bacterium]